MTVNRRSGGRLTALAATTALALPFAPPAAAQTVAPALPTVPLNDVDCNWDDASQARTVPPCATDGTRTVTYQGRTRQVRNATTDYLIDSYTVQFSGNLKVDGVPVVTAPGGVFPFGNTQGTGGGAIDAANFFGTGGQTVNVTSSYTGDKFSMVPTGGAGNPPDPAVQAYWSRVTNLSSTINAIDIQLDSTFTTTTGGDYDFQLNSVNPNAVVNNATALAGRFSGTAGNGAIQFGKLAGTATVTSGYNTTPYPAGSGATDTGLLSLYRLGYSVSAQVTTNLDENGLTTPKVTVTNGIAMGGSTITGLGAGVNPTDAVNLQQMQAAITASGAGGGTASPYLKVNSTGPAATAGGSDAVAIGPNSSASSLWSVAMGWGTKATAQSAVAIGTFSNALGNDAVAIGANASGGSIWSVALGTGANSSNQAAVAAGAFAKASGTSAVALGGDGLDGDYDGAQATGSQAVAIGADARAIATNAAALGASASASGVNSVALGANSSATQSNTVSIGSVGSERRIVNLAAGTSGTDAVNKAQLDAAIAAIGSGSGGGGSALVAATTPAGAPTATGSYALAAGGGASASGASATAIGNDAAAQGNYATAIGRSVSAQQQLSTVIGYGSTAGELGAAIGATANAGGYASVAIGYNAAATQSAATAIGQGAQATGVLSAAVGQSAVASAVNTAAYGARAVASGAYSTAIGASASATHYNSTAVGGGATTTAANQVVLGAAGTSVKLGDIAASTAAQVGPVNVVTVDANGTLGRQAAASPAAVERVQASVDYIAAVTDSQFAELTGRTSVIESRLSGIDHRLDGIEGGVAAAMAMGQAKLVPDANVSMTVAAATYGGRQGFAGSLSGRVAEKVYVSGSVSGNTGDKRVGGAVSATFGF